MFFDGVSKGNPRIIGAGGLILSLDRSSEIYFSWGLWKCLKNQAECYSLLKACQIVKDIGYKAIHIFRDSELLIKVLNSEYHFSNPSLNKSLQRIRDILKAFDRVVSNHILHYLNKQADYLENKACLMTQGSLNINEEFNSFQPLP